MITPRKLLKSDINLVREANVNPSFIGGHKERDKSGYPQCIKSVSPVKTCVMTTLSEGCEEKTQQRLSDALEAFGAALIEGVSGGMEKRIVEVYEQHGWYACGVQRRMIV